MAKRVVYRQFRFVRPHRVRRTQAETAAVWRARLPRYVGLTGCWALLTLVWAGSEGWSSAVTRLTAVAFLANLAVCGKALLLMRRGS